MDNGFTGSGRQVTGRSCDEYMHAGECFEAIRACQPGASITFLNSQGYCSYTFLVSNWPNQGSQLAAQHIVQFRHTKFALDLNTTAAAKRVYGSYAPGTKEVPHLLSSKRTNLSLRAYQMDLIGGVTYKSIAPTHRNLTDSEFERQLKLVEGFANFIARAWPVDSNQKVACTGVVGSVLPQKTQALAEQLPSSHLRAAARDASRSLTFLEILPNVLNHGDIVQSNVMVDPATFHLVGFVDWAEAEWLPFGTCLYGLEHFLGVTTSSESGQQSFEYYNRAYELRFHFWRHLRALIPTLESEDFRDALLLAKRVGTLLWHGFAWDDGAIDRVVNERDDAIEIAHLKAFLSASGDDFQCLKQYRKDSVVN